MKLLIEMIGMWGGYLLFILTLIGGFIVSHLYFWEHIIVNYFRFPLFISILLSLFTSLFLAFQVMLNFDKFIHWLFGVKKDSNS